MIVNTFDDDKKVDEIDHLAQSIILSLPIFLFFWRGGFSTNLLALELKQNDLLVSIFSFLIFLPSLRALLSRKLDDKDIVWSFVIQSFFYFLAWKTDFIKLLNENQLQILKLFALFQLILFAFKLEINNSDMVKIKVFVVFNQVLTFFGLLLQSDLFLEILFFNGLIYLSILYMDTKLNLLSNIVLFCLILIVPFTPWFELKLSIFKAAFMSSYDLTYLTVLLLLGIQLRWGFLLFCKFIKAHLFDRLKAS